MLLRHDLFQGKARKGRSPRQGDLEKEEGGDDSDGHASRAKGSNDKGTGIEHGRERKTSKRYLTEIRRPRLAADQTKCMLMSAEMLDTAKIGKLGTMTRRSEERTFNSDEGEPATRCTRSYAQSKASNTESQRDAARFCRAEPTVAVSHASGSLITHHSAKGD